MIKSCLPSKLHRYREILKFKVFRGRKEKKNEREELRFRLSTLPNSLSKRTDAFG